MMLRLTPWVVALFITGCAAERRDWAFVQSVGGMALGAPYRTASGVVLPVSIDVSGLKKITTQPRVMNSGLALESVVVRRDGHTLELAVTTVVATRTHQRTSSTDLALGEVEPGRYAVVYAEPHGGRVDLGEIVVEPD